MNVVRFDFHNAYLQFSDFALSFDKTKSIYLIATSRHKSFGYKFDIFQKVLFRTLVSSANFVLKTVQNEAGQYL